VFRLNKNQLIPLVSVIVLILALAFFVPLFTNPALSTLRQPLGLVTLIQREIGGIIFFHRNLVQNEILRREIDFLRFKLNAANEMNNENMRLRNLLSFKQQAAYKVIAARVIGRSLDNWSSSIIIEKGRSHGVNKGMSVINYLGLVGKVIETTENTSKVMLINDPSLGVSAIISRSRQEGLVSGTLGTFLIMKYLPEDPDVKIQDTVISSGMNQVYPKGILIGTVVEIGKEFSGLSRWCLVKPAVDPSNIEEVLVIVQ